LVKPSSAVFTEALLHGLAGSIPLLGISRFEALHKLLPKLWPNHNLSIMQGFVIPNSL
jgi:hypothetical protein